MALQKIAQRKRFDQKGFQPKNKNPPLNKYKNGTDSTQQGTKLSARYLQDADDRITIKALCRHKA